ncbi:MAG: ImmA/IrrE family metallo-endopeptidase [Brumimicrobium sp.]
MTAFNTVEHNTARIRHLIRMFRLSVPEFLEKISIGLKNPVTEDDVFGNEIKLNHLKRIDKLFEKGLHYYLDPKAPETSKKASIFFRKESFNTESLNIGAVKTVNAFEDLKHSLSAIAKLSELRLERKIKKYSISTDPEKAAIEIREKLYPKFDSNRRNFLKALITKLADYNIMVFEFVETWNKKEKANIDGFYLKPNMIVLKRYQSFTREIFTLAHELGHYLLDEEEVESVDGREINLRHENRTETWCNVFAFHFLAGRYSSVINEIGSAGAENDYHFETIVRISQQTHLSRLALYTKMLFNNQINHTSYKKVKNDLEEEFLRKEEEREREKQRKKELGIKTQGRAPKPIKSPLLVSTIQQAYYSGVLDEYEVGKKLNIKPEKIGDFIE